MNFLPRRGPDAGKLGKAEFCGFLIAILDINVIIFDQFATSHFVHIGLLSLSTEEGLLFQYLC